MRSSLDKALNNLLDLGNPGVRRDRAEQIDQALRTLLALTDGDAAAILLPGRSDRLVLHVGSPAPSITPTPAEGGAIAQEFAQDPQPLSIPDLMDDNRYGPTDGCPGVDAGPALFAALRRRGPGTGYLAVYRRRGRARFTPNDTRAIVLLATTLQQSLETLRLQALEKLAFTDDLTEVYNARFVKSALKRELRRASRFGQELSLLLVAADGFESWEERAGQSAGEAWTRELASKLVQQVRSFDFVARSGAGRFLVVLPQTPRDGAIEVAERIRAAIHAHPFPGADAGAVTVSLGVSSFPQEGAEPGDLVAIVERSLATAQARGGNCVDPGLDRAA